MCVCLLFQDVAYRFQDLCPSTEEEEGKATLELTKEYDTVEEEEGEERRAQRKEEGKGGKGREGGEGERKGRGGEGKGERREGLGYHIHMLIHLQMMSKTRRQLLVQSIH